MNKISSRGFYNQQIVKLQNRMLKQFLICCVVVCSFTAGLLKNKHIQLELNRENILEFTGGKWNSRNIKFQNIYRYTFSGLPSFMKVLGSRLTGRPPAGISGRWLIGVNYTNSMGSKTDTFWLVTKGLDTNTTDRIYYIRGVLDGNSVGVNLYNTNNLIVIIPLKTVRPNLNLQTIARYPQTFQGYLGFQPLYPQFRIKPKLTTIKNKSTITSQKMLQSTATQRISNSAEPCALLESKLNNANRNTDDLWLKLRSQRLTLKDLERQQQYLDSEKETYLFNGQFQTYYNRISQQQQLLKKYEQILRAAEAEASRTYNSANVAQIYLYAESIIQSIASNYLRQQQNLGGATSELVRQSDFADLNVRTAEKWADNLNAVNKQSQSELEKAKKNYLDQQIYLGTTIDAALSQYRLQNGINNAYTIFKRLYETMAKLRKEQRRINSSEITYYQNYLEQNTSKLLLNACRSARWTSIETRYQDPTCDKSAYPSRKDEGNIEYFDDSFIQIREARLYVGDCTELSGCPNYRSKSKYVSYSAVTVSGRLWATRIDC